MTRYMSDVLARLKFKKRQPKASMVIKVVQEVVKIYSDAERLNTIPFISRS